MLHELEKELAQVQNNLVKKGDGAGKAAVHDK